MMQQQEGAWSEPTVTELSSNLWHPTVLISDDGKTIVVGGDTCLFVIDGWTSRFKFFLDVVPSGYRRRSAFSRDSTRFYVVESATDNFLAFDTNNNSLDHKWQQLSSLTISLPECRAIAASPKRDNEVLMVSASKTSLIFHVTSQMILAELEHDAYCHACAYSKSGDKVAIGLAGGTIVIWQIDVSNDNSYSATRLLEWQGHAKHVNFLQFLKQDSALISHGADRFIDLSEIKIPDISSSSSAGIVDAEAKLITSKDFGEEYLIHSVSVSSDDETVAVSTSSPFWSKAKQCLLDSVSQIQLLSTASLDEELCEPLPLYAPAALHPTRLCLFVVNNALRWPVSAVATYVNHKLTKSLWLKRRGLLLISAFTRRRIRLALCQWICLRKTAYFL